LNHCVGNYIYEESQTNHNTIRSGDVVKIELGVNIGGCIAILGETFVKGGGNTVQQNYIDFLNDLAKHVIGLCKQGETNDEIRMLVESKCTEQACFPLENCIGYQQCSGQLKTAESKYIVFNHQKYYDENDNLCVEENLCFDLEPGEVYTINLTVVPDLPENAECKEHCYKEFHEPHIYRFNDYFYNLKLKSSREFVSRVKGLCGNNAFVLAQYLNTGKDKLGKRECWENGILDSYPIRYHKGGCDVYHKKFTVIVGEDKAITLKYN
jgi:methionine aminopeptidase